MGGGASLFIPKVAGSVVGYRLSVLCWGGVLKWLGEMVNAFLDFAFCFSVN